MAGRPFPFSERGSSRYGAQMGRYDKGPAPDGYAKVTMRRVRLSQGYDRGGAYWGDRPRGLMLFCAWTRDRSFIRYIDAPTYLVAQEVVRREAPDVEFL